MSETPVSAPVTALADMLAGMEPELHALPHVFMHEDRWTDFSLEISTMFASIHEGDEGTTYIYALEQDWPMAEGLPRFARITLQVHSDLEGVGLTAAVATGLADEGIACNVIAGLNHDHLFVPWDRRGDAMNVLKRISDEARD